MNKNILIILALVILIIYFFIYNKQESFALNELVDLETDINGQKIIYNIKNIDGKDLISSAFTPVDCNTVMIKSQKEFIPPNEKGWILKKISKGIYVFEKPSKKECLYAYSGYNENSLRSYSTTNCNHQSLCGLDTLDFKNSIDENSLRTYFRIVKKGNGYNIISVKNNLYVCLNNEGVTLQSSPDKYCEFNIEKL
jgi:hypothetical protein